MEMTVVPFAGDSIVPFWRSVSLGSYVRAETAEGASSDAMTSKTTPRTNQGRESRNFDSFDIQPQYSQARYMGFVLFPADCTGKLRVLSVELCRMSGRRNAGPDPFRTAPCD